MVDLGRVMPGAKANVELDDGTVLQREVVTGSSYLASEDPRIHFGLGRNGHIATLTIVYPDGRTQRFEDVSANATIEAQDIRK